MATSGSLVHRLPSQWRSLLRRRLIIVPITALLICQVLNVVVLDGFFDNHPEIELSQVLSRHRSSDVPAAAAVLDEISEETLVFNTDHMPLANDHLTQTEQDEVVEPKAQNDIVVEPKALNEVETSETQDEVEEPKAQNEEVEERHAGARAPAGQTCEEFLEIVDKYEYGRDYWKSPIVVERNQDHIDRNDCDLGCHFTNGYGPFDATYNSRGHVPAIKYTMESYTNYPDTKLETAKSAGYEIVMTPRLDADVSVVYFGWNSFDPMRPAVPGAKKDNALAAFISNCGASSFRNMALTALEAPEANLTVQSYGHCLRNMHDQPGGRAEKSDVFPRVKFSLAFENSEEPDYVTEKFFQSLDFGAIPIVIGAPNIQRPTASYTSSLDEMPALIEHLHYLMNNDTAYDEMHAYKVHGPTDNFLALVDLGITHPDCRLCIVLADRQRRHEREDKPKDRPCACRDKSGDRLVHHLYVRERGKFAFKSIFMEHPLKVEALHAKIHSVYGPSSGYKPVWTLERPSYRKKLDNGTWDRSHQPLRIHKIYPAGSTTKDALFSPIPDSFRIGGDSVLHDAAFRQWVAEHPCGELEVIFV